MPNALPAGTGTKVFSGARAIFMFNGSPVAFASGVDGSEEIQYQAVEVLDNLEVVEYVPVGYRVTLTCAMFRTISKGASTTETPGSIKQQNIFPTAQSILTTEGVDVLIIDRISNKAIATFQNVKTSSYRFSITARGIVAQNVTFMSTRMTDEAE
jgi:hypothetical protein